MRKMVSLALSQEDKERDHPMMIGYGAKDDGEPSYPPGCCIYLDDPIIKKLDLDDEGVEKGDSLHCMTVFKVVRVSDGPEGKCLHLQITDIGIEGEDQSESSDVKSDESRAKGRYGSDEGED